MSTAQELAKNYMEKHNSTNKAINLLIHYAKYKSSDFWLFVRPWWSYCITCCRPSKYSLRFLYVQMRIVAAIAYMRGFDVNDDEVKTLLFVTLTRNSAKQILKGTRIKIGKKMFGKKLFESTLRNRVTVDAF